jgi:hypothetical protein
MESETIRTLLIDYLREFFKPNQRDQLQWEHCYIGVSHKARERGAANVSHGERLSDEDALRLKHVIWDLVLERLLTPGTTHPRSGNDGWPFLSVTDHGRKVLAEQKPVPYDPDNYLANLKKSVPTVDRSVVEYLAEAVGTFRTGNYLASAVMLGAASEMVFNELSIAIPPVMSDVAKRDKLAEKMQKGKMKDRLATILGWCRNNASQLPGAWSGDEQADDIDKIADLVRRRRNEAGRPEDPPRRPTREQMYSYLMLFPEYCKHLYVLKDWAMQNAGKIT